MEQEVSKFLADKLQVAKVQFERALECKHTEFDDLYPFMTEHPEFFWYKRFVAWSELLTIVKLCEELGVRWKDYFEPRQIKFLERKLLQSDVINEWFEAQVTSP
jgi:hypothetical protein